MKIRPVEAALFNADGRTERRQNGKTDITHLNSLVAALPRSVKPGKMCCFSWRQVFHTCRQLAMHSVIYSHDFPYFINFTLPQNKEHFACNFWGVLHKLYDGDS